MRQLTMLRRVFIKNKYESTKRPAEVIRLFGIEYPDRPLFSTATIWKINKKFNENGTILNLNKGLDVEEQVALKKTSMLPEKQWKTTCV